MTKNNTKFTQLKQAFHEPIIKFVFELFIIFSKANTIAWILISVVKYLEHSTLRNKNIYKLKSIKSK